MLLEKKLIEMGRVQINVSTPCPIVGELYFQNT
jgi:hypothetical protein